MQIYKWWERPSILTLFIPVRNLMLKQLSDLSKLLEGKCNGTHVWWYGLFKLYSNILLWRWTTVPLDSSAGGSTDVTRGGIWQMKTDTELCWFICVLFYHKKSFFYLFLHKILQVYSYVNILKYFLCKRTLMFFIIQRTII